MLNGLFVDDSLNRKFNNYQFIGSMFLFIKYLFVFEKCLQPKNPREADRGDG